MAGLLNAGHVLLVVQHEVLEEIAEHEEQAEKDKKLGIEAHGSGKDTGARRLLLGLQQKSPPEPLGSFLY
ncbi:hypothetical protein GCM10026977_30360 [Hymenobacter qilianensis]